MLPAGRKSELEALVTASRHVTVTELAARFDVSPDTIRRDLDQLDAEGRLVRTRGGAMSLGASTRPEMSVSLRQEVSSAAKDVIAQLAAGLISDSSSIIINAGSTGIALAHRLSAMSDLTVATNNVLLPAEIDPACAREVFLFGGRVRIGPQSTVGPVALGVSAEAEQIQISADIALIGIGGVSVDGGYSMSDPGEAQMTATMMRRAALVAVMVDSTKFDTRLFAEIAPLDAADVLVTDHAPPRHLARALHDADVRVLRP